MGGDGDGVVLRGRLMSISIHTTRVGGDEKMTIQIDTREKISIHTTRVGGDISASSFFLFILKFQSTPPVWVVTFIQHRKAFVCAVFQSTPPVWVVTF